MWGGHSQTTPWAHQPRALYPGSRALWASPLPNGLTNFSMMPLTQRECTFFPRTIFWGSPISFPVCPLCFCLKSLCFPPFTHLHLCCGLCSQEIVQWFLYTSGTPADISPVPYLCLSWLLERHRSPQVLQELEPTGRLTWLWSPNWGPPPQKQLSVITWSNCVIWSDNF